jgi:hypothetical protein
MGWGALAFRTDKGDLLACGNRDGSEESTHRIYRIPLSKDFATPELRTTTPVLLFAAQPGNPGFQPCDGVAWDTVENRIYQSPDVFHTIYRFNETGAPVGGNIAVPASCNPTLFGEATLGAASGVSIAGENLYIGCSEDPEIYRVNKNTGAVLQIFTSPHLRSSDLECDPISFGAVQKDVLWTKGAYDDILNAVEVPRGTCGGSPPVAGGPLCSKLDGTPDLTDTDGDGLLDCWEKPSLASAGAGGQPCIDHDGDGVCDLRLCVDSGDGKATVCADPYRKDVFVEVDWLQGHQPDQPAITAVINRFEVAPVANPVNPNTLTSIAGIRLHVQVNEVLKNGPTRSASVIPHTSTTNHLMAFEPYTAAATGANVLDFDQLKGNNFGTIDERENPKALAAKRQAFRYMIFGHLLVGLAGTSGAAEVHGNDGIVTLGAATSRNSHNIGTADEQAGTFMHELGHLLGLRHGGGDFVGCKPNYLSVMNYTRQFPSRPIPADIWRSKALDFSPSKLPDLNKSILIETVGINAPAEVAANNVTVFGPSTSAGVYKSTSGAVDWNRNNLTSAAIISILRLNEVGSGCPSEGTGPDRNLLEGYNDWANLKLDVRSSLDIADGDRLSLDEKEPEQGFPSPTDAAGNEINPCTAASCPVALSTTDTGTAEAPVVVPVDGDADGIPDLADNCPAVSNANQTDSNGDGIGDACQESNVSIDIRPGRYPNTVSLNSPFQLTVAILGANGFNATSVRPDTVLLSGAKVLRRGQLHLCGPLDVNGDGFTDLVCVVDKRDLVLPSDQAIAVLTAKTHANVSIRGEDSIHILRGTKSHHEDD